MPGFDIARKKNDRCIIAPVFSFFGGFLFCFLNETDFFLMEAPPGAVEAGPGRLRHRAGYRWGIAQRVRSAEPAKSLPDQWKACIGSSPGPSIAHDFRDPLATLCIQERTSRLSGSPTEVTDSDEMPVSLWQLALSARHPSTRRSDLTGTNGHRGVACQLQRRSAAQRPRRSNRGGVCRILPRHCNFNP